MGMEGEEANDEDDKEEGRATNGSPATALAS